MVYVLLVAAFMFFTSSALLLFCCAVVQRRAEEIAGEILAERFRQRQQYTVRWQETGAVQQAYTGTIRPQGRWHIVIEDDAGWPVVVDRRDIIEMT